MKTLTKAKRFMERMEMVEGMNERQLTEMVFRAASIISEYVEREERKEKAYVELKEATKYRAKQTKEKEVKRMNIAKEVVTKIKEEVITDTKLVVMNQNEEKGISVGCYHKNGTKTYFINSNKYSHPVVIGNPALTTEVREALIDNDANCYNEVTKQLKEVSLFSKIGNKNAMVHLVDSNRQVFEGYIGDMVFSTTTEYLEKGYKPLVTDAKSFVANGGKHNHVMDNECSDVLRDCIIKLIDAYKTTKKYTKANRDVDYINNLKFNNAKKQMMQQEPVQQQRYEYGLYDIANQNLNTINGGGNYDPVF